MVHKRIRGELTSYVISSSKKSLPGVFAEERAARYGLQFCEHTLQQLADTINYGEQRLITSVDLRRQSRLCHTCSLSKAKKAFLP